MDLCDEHPPFYVSRLTLYFALSHMIHVHSQVCDMACRSRFVDLVVVEKRVCPHREIKSVGLKREFVHIMKSAGWG